MILTWKSYQIILQDSLPARSGQLRFRDFIVDINRRIKQLSYLLRHSERRKEQCRCADHLSPERRPDEMAKSVDLEQFFVHYARRPGSKHTTEDSSVYSQDVTAGQYLSGSLDIKYICLIDMNDAIR